MTTSEGNRSARIIDPTIDANIITTPRLDSGRYRIEFTASASVNSEIVFALQRNDNIAELVPLFVGVGLVKWEITAPVEDGDVFAVINKASGLRIVCGSVSWQCVGVKGGL